MNVVCYVRLRGVVVLLLASSGCLFPDYTYSNDTSASGAGSSSSTGSPSTSSGGGELIGPSSTDMSAIGGEMKSDKFRLRFSAGGNPSLPNGQSSDHRLRGGQPHASEP